MDPQSRIERLVPQLQGWCTVAKALHLMGLIRRNRPEVVVELGVYGGRSLLPMVITCASLQIGQVYGVDPWAVDPALEGVLEEENRVWWSESVDLEQIFQGYETACQTLLLPAERERMHTMRMTSAEAASTFDPGEVNLLHQDGNHSELVSCQEVEQWDPLVAAGGIWVFDDINWPSTQKALEMLRQRCELVSEIRSAEASYAVFRKR